MKKIFFIVVLIISVFYSTVFAFTTIVNPTIQFLKSKEVEKPPFSDLYVEEFDERGKPLVDRETKEQYFTYNLSINEIDKATRITIDNSGTKLIAGYEDGTFRPKNNITKGEFIKLAIGISVNKSFDFSRYEKPFEHWAAPYVAVAELHGVLNKGEFNETNINDPITRLDAILILSKIQTKMKGIPLFTDGTLPNYTDIEDISDEDKAYIKHACRYDLFEGMVPVNLSDETQLQPNENLTRADAARAIMRVY